MPIATTARPATWTAYRHRTVTQLIGRAQEQGTVRADVTVEELLFLLAALGRVVPASEATAPGAWPRHLHLLLAGLRAEAAAPLSAPPLTPDQLTGTLRTLTNPRRQGLTS
ncbi:hypothetical protein ABZ769_23485 [Streptomyces olivoreticuli]